LAQTNHFLLWLSVIVRNRAWPLRRGHTSLATTQKYIQGDSAAKLNVMKLI
jgi:hypothetical protein